MALVWLTMILVIIKAIVSLINFKGKENINLESYSCTVCGNPARLRHDMILHVCDKCFEDYLKNNYKKRGE